ncbi:FAD-dependent oxidoreductase [uncultured Umboniibacter sp.]|uniref:NAD(P)/FAD-dependent oxidoreductase n=1 Tax=uncultured Umboniibacter sp. TaxID=1798917 RepID=UPI00260EED06|nr:FAD-dependent oxidoreductase [uncultured Umboniibacter sp.]
MTKIAIIGAGLAGLTAATLLRDYASVTVFDKARGVGGRQATRRALPYVFDHGAQYFTARTPEFSAFISPYVSSGAIARWNARYQKFAGSEVIDVSDWTTGEPRYVGVGGMNQLCKHIAGGVEVITGTRIESLRQQHDSWYLVDQSGTRHGQYDWVILCAPAPQSVALLPQSFEHLGAIKAIQMVGCISLMLGFESAIEVNFDAAHIEQSDVSWIAVNSSKPGRTEPFSLVVHSSEEYGRLNLDDPSGSMSHLIAEAGRVIGHDLSQAQHQALHTWRYANNTQHHLSHDAFVDTRLNLAVCGDWCEGGRVEGAFTSAAKVVRHLRGALI